MKKDQLTNKQKINDDVTKYSQKLDYALFNLNNEDFYKYFENAFLNGDRTLYQKNISEAKTFDDTWIKTVESYFPSLDKITREPKSILRYDEDIVAVERAKKTSAKSVRHLASHTENIRDIDENNYVTPKKVLIEIPEQEYAIYENRFIKTLINRLYLFVKNRYEIIKNNVESFQKDRLSGTANFDFNDTKVELSVDLTITKDLDDKKINEHNYDLLARTEKLNYLITGLKNSQFMKLLKNAPAVHPPIMKTNIIMKNPEFRNAYNLWIFLDKYSILGYDVTIREKDLEFDDGFIDDINHMFATNYAIILGNQLNRLEKYNVPDGYQELIKKKTKIVSQNPKDFVPNPDLIEMEESHLNEFFLQKYKELLNSGIDKETKNEFLDEPNDAIIKRNVRQTTDIVNALYDAKFEISEEADILHRLEDTDLEKEYQRSLEQLRYAKIIREVKEVDYNNFFRTERRLLRALSKTNTEMIKKLIEERKYEEKERKIKEIEAKIDALKKENEERSKQIDALNDHQTLMKEEKQRLVDERNKTINKVDEEMKKYDAMMEAKYEEERQRVLAQLQAEKERAKELKAAEDEAKKYRKQALNDMIAEERAKAQEEMEAKFKLHREEMEAALNDIRDIAIRYQEKIQSEVERRELENSQKEKEAIAIFKVSKYEEALEQKNRIELESAEAAYNKALAEKQAKIDAKTELDNKLKELDDEYQSRLSSKLQDLEAEYNEAMAQVIEKPEILEEQETQEVQEDQTSSDVLDDAEIQEKVASDLARLQSIEEEERKQEEERLKAEAIEVEKLEALKEAEAARLQEEAFEAKRQEIEAELNNSYDNSLEEEKQKQINLNAIQREKEAKAISLVQAYEKGKKDEEALALKEEEEKALAEQKRLDALKFEEDQKRIEAQIEEQARLEEKKQQIKLNAIQREKENKAISLVQEYENKRDAKSIER